MQMDKRNCSADYEQPRLSQEGIRFTPGQVESAAIDLSTAAISTPALLRVDTDNIAESELVVAIKS